MNPILKWALQILLQTGDPSLDDSVINALALLSIDANQDHVNRQPLHSIFSVIGENPSVDKKEIPWQVLDPQNIVYPTEGANNVTLNIRELEQNWERFPANENLALALIEKYSTFLSISPDVPHISFYDAVKSAAAIHDCLVCESADKEKPFLLVSGDFSGIQETVYTIASGGALKTLRARSFMLELLTEHIIYEIYQATGCGRYSLIFSGGGGFSLLVPNTDDNQKAISNFIKIINEWMLEQFSLQLFLAVHCEPMSKEDLTGDSFKNIWESMADQMAKQKHRKFWDTSNFEDLFCPKMPKQLANQDACQITHRDDLPDSEMKTMTDNRRVTKFAYNLWRLGDLLTEFDRIFRFPVTEDDSEEDVLTKNTEEDVNSSTSSGPDDSQHVDDPEAGTLLFPTHLSQPGKYQYAEYQVKRPDEVSTGYEACWLVNNWELADYKDNNTFPFLFGSYVKSVEDLPKAVREYEKAEYQKDHNRKMSEGVTASFSGLAKAAQGIELIGCLRMDVDDFGDLFSGELVKSGIAALSNLSRSMNLFFKGYLNEICGMNLGALPKEGYPLDISGEKSKTLETDNYRYVSIVYAGGDDLFIVGAWDDVAELAFDINISFREFSCSNPEVHLSAGVTLHKPKFPLYQMAEIAKAAEEVAKANEWIEHGRKREKESLSLFYTHTLARHNAFLNDRISLENLKLPPAREQPDDRIAVASRWDEYDSIVQLTQQLYKFSRLPNVPHGFYRKLFETLRIWQEEGPLYLPMLSYTKYQFGKKQEGIPEANELKGMLTDLIRFDQMRKLHIPLHWVEYLNRQGGGED
ncbi:MAG: type III-A CRISPR-associated protein Cas10/Csm1 [Candidatus Poribacteria bacterium]|nr:type III-A CRISPR-associated protein Cas10/Csm1 [Candidatus Poribacteria bacterium]